MNNIEKEILSLRNSLFNMFLLVESQWEKGARAILDYDQDIAEEISSSEKRINAQELIIDSECENIIALHSPVAIDLRFILSTYKINHALEHIADIAKSIAQYVSKSDTVYDKNIIEELQVIEMLDVFNSMMDDVISAFKDRDSRKAKKVFRKDRRLNEINSNAPVIISKYISSHDKEMLLYLLSTIRKVERAGDSLKKNWRRNNLSFRSNNIKAQKVIT